MIREPGEAALLRMTPAAAESELDGRIALGEELLSRGRMPADPEALIRDTRSWSATNEQLLSRMFTTRQEAQAQARSDEEPESAGSPYVDPDVLTAYGAVNGRLTHLRSVKNRLPYFVSATPDSTSQPDPEFWRSHHFRLFISHVHAQHGEVAAFQGALRRYHISGFVAHADIAPAREWENEILAALRTADALAAWLTNDFHPSYWTDQEVGFSMGREKLVISIQRDDCTPYGFIGRNQAVNGRGKDARKLAEEVFAALIRHDTTRRRMSEALIFRFEESESFAEATENVGLLERLPKMEADLVGRAQAAVTNNRQVRDAWGVPERVRHL